MTNNRRLKVLVAVLFVLMAVMVGMLIYAVNVYKNNDTPASGSDTSAADTSASASPSGAAGSDQQKETIDLKLYIYDAEDYDNPKEISTQTIDKKLYEENLTEALSQLLAVTDLRINKAVINGSLITVDLPKDMALKFNSGSASGITYTNILAMTTLNLPGIEKLKITVEGEENIESDHFSFNGTFVKSEDGKKYTLTDQGDGKTLDY